MFFFRTHSDCERRNLCNLVAQIQSGWVSGDRGSKCHRHEQQLVDMSAIEQTRPRSCHSSQLQAILHRTRNVSPTAGQQDSADCRGSVAEDLSSSTAGLHFRAKWNTFIRWVKAVQIQDCDEVERMGRSFWGRT
ncbi:hypothetical protein NDU88_000912 [Pleurodeles waltl]|uniref:Uncharacterized protein n=1 Tax=Pleurodeles waltl TaxID=8319 RepID=A0AAV7LG21_PLEWA|nr:hypothetical protein NDU88_000912 [Pleurodeles waltl]